MLISSNKYKIRIEGRAINIRIIAGKIVQIISIICPCNKNRLIYLLKNNIIIMYDTIDVIIVKLIKYDHEKKLIVL